MSYTPRHYAARLSAVALLFALCLPALLAAAPAKYSIPTQSAEPALEAFAKQSGTKVLYGHDEVAGITASAVDGEYEPAVALGLLLKDTPLTFTERKPGSFIVKKAVAPVTTGSVRGNLARETGAPAEGVKVMINETGQQARTDKSGEYIFPSVEPGTYVLVVTAEGYQPLHVTDVVVKAGNELTLSREDLRLADGTLKLEPFVVRAESVTQLEKIEVVGTKPTPFSDRNVDLPRSINDVQPYYIFNSQTLEESGASDVEDFLKQRLTMDTTLQTNSQITHYQNPSAIPTTASSINLRGLGTDHTLILVNGIPMAGVAVFTGAGIAQPGQPDVNGIPFSAIDRIEVLPSSAGAIYGAGAEGGVINIILKKSFTGGEVKATYGSTWDGHGASRAVEATVGRSFEGGKTQVFVTAQYSDQSPMFVRDRIDILNRGYAKLLENDPAFLGLSTSATPNAYFPPVGATPNFASARATYPAPAGTPGSTPRGVGFRTSSGYLTTAENPNSMIEVLPLTLKRTGSALGGANPYIATLPSGYSATSSPSSILGGTWNLAPGLSNEAPNGLLVPLGNYPRRKSLMATITRQMTPVLQLHLDYSHAENHSFSNYNPVQTQNGILIPADVPDNPFNEAVRVSFPTNYEAPAVSNTTVNAITGGGTLKLPFDWIAHLDYQWSSSAFSSYADNLFPSGSVFRSTPTFNQTLNENADNYPTPIYSGAVNPFVDTLAYPVNWAPFAEVQSNSGKTTSNELILAASGPVWHLPWGNPRLSIRADHNRTGEFEGGLYSIAPADVPYAGLPLSWFTTTSYAQSQTIDKVNAELDLPIFKSKLPLLRSLDSQFNLGYERSSVGIGTPGYLVGADYAYNINSPGVSFQSPTLANGQPYSARAVNSHTSVTGPALSYKPTDDLIFRFSVASGYVAPTYNQLLPDLNTNDAFQNGPFVDPKNPKTAPYYVNEYSYVGNPALKPQTSRSWNFGVIWEPRGRLLKGLRLDAEYTKTTQHNLIFVPSEQYIIDNEASFPNLVVRDSTTGLITTVYDAYVNLNEARSEAWDFSLDYQWSTSVGTFGFTAAETIAEHNQQQVAQGQPFLEYVGYPNGSGGNVKIKANATVRWAARNWIVAWSVVHLGSYRQYGSPGDPSGNTDNTYTRAQGGDTISSQTYHNLYLSRTFGRGSFTDRSRMGRWGNSVLNGVTVSLSVNNVFNTLPPFDAYYAPFYTSPYGGVQLRNYSLSIRKSF